MQLASMCVSGYLKTCRRITFGWLLIFHTVASRALTGRQTLSVEVCKAEVSKESDVPGTLMLDNHILIIKG